MDADRIDLLAHVLTVTRCRRGALAAVLGGLLGLLGLAATEARKKRKKGKSKRKNAGTPSPPPALSPPPPLPRSPEPTCTDRLVNGNETDVDCGGASCPRCVNGKSCTTRNDCVSAFCSGGMCQACSASADCGTDDNGGCICAQPATGGSKVCIHNVPTGEADFDCGNCPAGTSCVLAVTGQLYCVKPCGAA
jgi:hypothetical protein